MTRIYCPLCNAQFGHDGVLDQRVAKCSACGQLFTLCECRSDIATGPAPQGSDSLLGCECTVESDDGTG